MSARVLMKNIDKPFDRAWTCVQESCNTKEDVESNFKSRNIKLLSDKNEKEDFHWDWNVVIFKNKATYVMFMLEWS